MTTAWKVTVRAGTQWAAEKMWKPFRLLTMWRVHTHCAVHSLSPPLKVQGLFVFFKSILFTFLTMTLNNGTQRSSLLISESVIVLNVEWLFAHLRLIIDGGPAVNGQHCLNVLFMMLHTRPEWTDPNWNQAGQRQGWHSVITKKTSLPSPPCGTLKDKL